MSEPPTPPKTAHAVLRAATADRHAEVDRMFGTFDLADAQGYARFLEAHARALPAVEQALAGADGPPLRPRRDLLAQDLSALGRAMPAPLDLPPPANAAEAFGYAYVIEGSRLGGAMLARSVPEDLPRAYLSDGHLSGEWRAFGAALDDAAERGGPEWLAQAGAAADSIFTLYTRAAETALEN